MQEHDVYEPAGLDADEPIRRATKPNVKRLNRKPVIILVVGIAGCFFLALASVFQPKVPDAKTDTSHEGQPHASELVNEYPDDYTQFEKQKKAAELAATPKLGPPRPNEFGVAQVQVERGQTAITNSRSEAEKLADEERAERLRAAIEARKSKVSFSGGLSGGENKLSGAAQPATPTTEDIIKILQSSQPQAGGGTLQKQVDTNRDASNRQDDKWDFSGKKRTTDPYLQQGVVTPLSPYYVAAGTIIPGVLLTGINSDLPGQITGQVSQNVYDTITGNYLLIPQGAKLVGEYNSVVTYGQERVQIIWTRIIRPDGTSITLEGMPGVDMSGNSGLTDKVNNHYGKLLTGVVLSSLIGAGAQVAQGSTYNQINPSFSQLATQGASQNINQVGQQITQKNLEIQPTLEIRPGLRFNVFVQKDVQLPEYTTQQHN